LYLYKKENGMRIRSLLLSVLLIVTGCATYKQLKPKPDPTPVEGGYLELKHDAKNFELKKDKRYFITFPGPQEDHFYLVLSIPDKKKIKTIFTSSLIDNSKYGEVIRDETPYPDSVSALPVDKKAPIYYWLIDNVPENMVLTMRYRYAPQWRYKFETHHATFKATLVKNRVDRKLYNSIGAGSRLEGFNFPLVMDTVGKHTAELTKVHKELLDIESIFPAAILNSKDVAYQDYLVLKRDLEDEINFQTNYKTALDFFYKESQSRTNPLDFISRVDDFTGFFAAKDKYPQPLVKEAAAVLKGDLDVLPSFYNQRLGTKTDFKPLEDEFFRLKSFNKLGKLFELSGIEKSADILELHKFLNDFQAKSSGLAAVSDSMEKLNLYVKNIPQMPPDDAFRTAVSRAEALQAMFPKQFDQNYGKYQSYPCAAALNQEILRVAGLLAGQLDQYRQVAAVVPQVNPLKAQNDYRGMLTILKPSASIPILVEKYRDLDKMSVNKQGAAIKSSLAAGAWREAETELSQLHADETFLNPTDIRGLKIATVLDYEDSLYMKVERLTRAKVNKFLDEKVNTLENVDSLYTDSVFLPAYNITFSSGSKADLLKRKAQLVADLFKMKDNEFPAKAIKVLYEQFVRSPEENGVLKARAIVTHGRHYMIDSAKGQDNEIRRRIAECDPHTAKWIVKPKDYRKIYALPVTDNRRGKNKFMVRLNVRIPTEAAFPVYDVNIKLPKEVAHNAAANQWYEEITCNKKELKNEGRFSISSPTAANDYECQITPVQMNKEGNNILEVVFPFQAFKPIPVSIMVQKPIIKKN
jgi:hypothetical protein